MSAGGGNEPNLTPFIDLFSVLVCFLLMTAAWLQLDTMNTSIEKAAASDAPSAEPEKKVQLAVDMATDRVVMKQDEKSFEIRNTGSDFNKRGIEARLKAWRAQFPDRRDVVLSTETGVYYGAMINMYDLLIAEGWPDVGISPQ
jgi:biopolymer transport protein TolR